MSLKLGENYNGFKLLKESKIEELNSISRVFIHEKSGARLFHIENEDDNKVFSISFRTPPKDSTGVAHILEHSVLCGSEKFPVKEPFIELVKGSLNTFLNAFTFGDKTMYPVASRNKKDFYNLMDVYLDAVLHPNIYKYPEIMMQEGWHYELNSKEEELTYKGVVYNEMKGALSAPESVLMRKVSESLFPDTTYGVESGGDPEFIPNLTQEAFLDFHKSYYHPSNSYIYLYGDMDILEATKFINEGYLKDYKSIEIDSSIKLQPAFQKQKRIEVDYPISSNEKEEDKTFLSLNYVIAKSTDAELYAAFDILENVLLETPAAPLKKALVDADLGKDVFGMFDNSLLQPTFSIVVKNSNEEKEEEFKSIVIDTLTKISVEGIDKKLIKSVINLKEFNLREADFNSYPKGLVYNILCMDSWLYDEDPTLHLKYSATMEKIKAGVDKGYFEDLIKNYILNNNHSTLLVVKPKKGMAEEKAKELQDKLSKYKNSLSEVEIDKIVEQTKKLIERQNAEDSPEDIKKIPLLSLKDIDKSPEKLPLEERNLGENKVLLHNIFTNEIAYINLYFDADTISQEHIPYLTLLGELLGNVATKNYSYEDLSNEININTGGVRYSARAYGEINNDQRYKPKFVVKGKVLYSNINKLTELMGEVIVNTEYNDKKRIKDLIAEIKSRYEMRIYGEGHVIAANRAVSYFSPIAKYNEILSGLSFYDFIVELDKNLDKNFEEISNVLKDISEKIFNKKNLLISITSPEEAYSVVINSVSSLIDNLNTKTYAAQKYEFEFKAENEGLITAGKVQYVAKGGNFKRLGYEYSGAMLLLRAVARYDYLWNKVRVQGGAYGCIAAFQKNGNMFFTSYRDPNLKETLEVYNQMHSYMKNLKVNERELTKYIIGTISELDAPLSPAMKGQVAATNYICNLKYENIAKERKEILEAKSEDISALGKLLEEVMKEEYICVMGSEEKINENKELFSKLINVIE